MTAHDPKLHRSPGGFLSWLGLGARAEGATTDLAANEVHRDSLQARQLETLGTFLIAHQLEVSAFTLTVAWNYLSRADNQVVRAIDRQIQRGEAITFPWLEEALGGDTSGEDIANLTQLMTRLESSIDEFGRASRDAHGATREYHSALEEHVNELEQVTKAGEVISELATIAKVMLKRTRDIERQMLRSEAQTRALRRRLDEARRSADEDHLTGLPNRRAFEAIYAEQYRVARATGETLCVAFCDIDNFKTINDTHGHDAGDRVLKLVAEGFARLSNEQCHVARHGGEEFVMLLRGTSLQNTFDRLDNLRKSLAERRLVNRATEEPFGLISFSGGIADVFACGDPRNALRAADAALYRAKQSGRNRVEIAGEADREPPRLCLPA